MDRSTFFFYFEEDDELNSVLHKAPWCFDGGLFALIKLLPRKDKFIEKSGLDANSKFGKHPRKVSL